MDRAVENQPVPLIVIGAAVVLPDVEIIDQRAEEELADIVDDGTISSKQGKDVFAEMFATGKAPGIIIEEKGLKQESDAGAIEALCREVIAANPKSVEAYKAGKTAAINFLKGQVMKLSKGKANPNLVSEVLAKLL